MTTNTSPARKIINVVLIIIIVLLLVLNLNFVKVHFLLFSLNLPLIVVMAGMFIAGRYVSKFFGGEFDPKKVEASLATAEKKVEGAINKGLEESKDYVEKAKDLAADAKENAKDYVEKAKDLAADAQEKLNEVAKKVEKKAPAKKPSQPVAKRPTTRK